MTFPVAVAQLKNRDTTEICLKAKNYTTVIWLGDDGFLRQVTVVGKSIMYSPKTNVLHLTPEDVCSGRWNNTKRHLTKKQREEWQ